MKKLGLLSVVLICLFLIGCGSEKGQWMGFYYPDKNNIWDENLWVIEKGFDSLDDCRKWATGIGKAKNDDYDYECGYKCKQNGEFYICEKTLD